jgi:hypothetical protein
LTPIDIALGEKKTSEYPMHILGGELVNDYPEHQETLANERVRIGRHPCAGMKIAKLELKIIVSIFVVGYEYDVVDLKGRLVERLPSPDYNQQQQVCLRL